MQIMDMKSAAAEDIAFVHVKAWRETYSGIIPQDYLDQLSLAGRTELWKIVPFSEGHHGRVAIVNGKVVGFVSFCLAREFTDRFAYELAAIYILKTYHKQGLGRGLIEAVLPDLKTKNFYAWVLEQNPSCAFYEGLGCTRFADKVDKISGKDFLEVAYSFENSRFSI